MPRSTLYARWAARAAWWSDAGRVRYGVRIVSGGPVVTARDLARLAALSCGAAATEEETRALWRFLDGEPAPVDEERR